MKTYTMLHKETGARIKCSKKYVVKWISRGFEVEEIDLNGELVKEEE